MKQQTQTSSSFPRGFTFIEVLVVAVLVTVLATIAMVAYTGAARSTRDSRRKQDVSNIRVALESYRQANGEYPPAAGCPTAQAGWSDCAAEWIVGLEPTYMHDLGQDPRQSAGWNGYGYIRQSDTEYLLIVYLENADDSAANGTQYGYDANAYVQEEPK